MLLEVNPRPSGSVAAALAAGYPFMDAAVAQLLGDGFTMPVVDNNVKVMLDGSGFVVTNPG